MESENSSKVVLITGCSSGFGLITAAYLAERGYHVIATMRNLERSSGLINETSKRGVQIELLPLDVTKKETIKEALAQIAEKHGFIDVLVNNAGYGIGGAFEDLTDEQRHHAKCGHYAQDDRIRRSGSIRPELRCAQRACRHGRWRHL